MLRSSPISPSLFSVQDLLEDRVEAKWRFEYKHKIVFLSMETIKNKNPLMGTFRFVGAGGIEPSTVGLKGHCSTD